MTDVYREAAKRVRRGEDGYKVTEELQALGYPVPDVYKSWIWRGGKLDGPIIMSKEEHEKQSRFKAQLYGWASSIVSHTDRAPQRQRPKRNPRRLSKSKTIVKNEEVAQPKPSSRGSANDNKMNGETDDGKIKCWYCGHKGEKCGENPPAMNLNNTGCIKIKGHSGFHTVEQTSGNFSWGKM